MGTIAGSVIALGADFLGSTSAILSLNPEFFRELRADVLYPIGGYKRCLESSQGFGKMQTHSGSSAASLLLVVFPSCSENTNDACDYH